MDINQTNNSLIKQIQNGEPNVLVAYNEGISPTRKNVLDNSKTSVIIGGVSKYPFEPANDSYGDISALLDPLGNEEAYLQCHLSLFSEIFKHIKSYGDDFDVEAYKRIFHTLSTDMNNQGVLIVRRGRKVTHGTGALLSEDDFKLIHSFPQSVVLCMYQIDGGKGWRQEKLWVPSVCFPKNLRLYTTEN